MTCAGAALSYAGMSATGGLLRGGGLRNAVSSIAGNLTGAAGGLINSHVANITALANVAVPGADSVATITSVAAAAGLTDSLGNPITELTGTSSLVSGALDTLGSSSASGLGSLTGAIGDGFTSIGATNFVDGLSSHATELFGANPLQMVQTFASAEAFANVSADLAGPIQAALGANFGQNLAAINKVLPISGEFGNYLGVSIPDIQAAVTNGFSSLTNSVGDITKLAGDLGNLGSAFNLQDIANFGNPGQLVNRLISAGGADLTGLSEALISVGLDVENFSNFASPQFNEILTDALGTITDATLISRAQALLGSNIAGLESLADFTDFTRVMRASFDDIPFDTFDQFREQLANTELGSLVNPSDLGSVLNAITTADLTQIANTTEIVDAVALDELVSRFSGGTGINGAITVSDVIGTIGGVGIRKPSTSYIQAMNELDDAGSLSTLKSMFSELNTGLTTFDYLDDPDTTIATNITDPRDSSVHTDLDSFVTNKISQIESEIASIATDTTISGAYNQAVTNWRQMQKKVVDEKTFASKTDLQLDIRDTRAENAYYFGTVFPERARDSDKVAIVDGMAAAAVEVGDVYGEHWKAFSAESKNKAVVEPYNIRWRNEYIEDV